ncbi:NEL-type E3 ubiquitin ligase domain-containing protein [Pseudomonas xanthosomatis]|uniref:NEL-type E3 ubiquitin ligase domain-containing protein n=1 Tax=Pseudomonas xanthosomatis TaxID=2842356 RepID=UPI00351834B9
MPTSTAFPETSIDHFIARQLPAWLVNATEQQRAALQAALLAQERAQANVRQVLQAVTPPDEFAAPLLAEALRSATQRALDVRRSRLRKVRLLPHAPAYPGGPIRRYEPFVSDQQLLVAAMHNFMPGEAFSPPSALYDEKGTRLALSPAGFIELCRTLDLGSQYQRYLASVLSAGDGLEQHLAKAYRANFEAAAHLESLRGSLREQAFKRLSQLFENAPATDDTTTLVPHDLRLLGKPLAGVLAVEVRAAGKPEGVLTWIPDDLVSPFNWHPSWPALYTAFSGRLADKGYQAFFQRFLRERDRLDFTRRLQGLLAKAPVATPVELDGRHVAVAGELFGHLAKAHVDKLLDDARVLVVPTGDEDRAARDLRLRGYYETGLTLLGLASLFVPALGLVMLGVTAAQVVGDIYEGYEAWQQGDREAALGHAFDVAGIVASGVVLAGAGEVAGRLLPRRAFVDALTPRVGASGAFRLAEQPLLAEQQGPGGLLRALGGAMSTVSDEDAAQLLQGTGYSQDQLRRLLLEEAQAPALLEDALARQRLRQRQPTLGHAALQAQLLAEGPAPEAAAQVVLRDFPGLSRRAARELVEQATDVQCDTLLAQQRVPLALAERARWLLRDGRLNRAFAGLREAGPVAQDSERLALAMLDELAPWPEGTGLEIREGSAQGTLAAQAGDEQAGHPRLIVRGAQGYTCLDADGERLPASTPSDSLAQALAHWLTPAQQARLGPVTADRLAERLARQAAGQREQAARAIGLAPVGAGLRPPVRLGDGRLGYPLSGRGESSHQALLRGLHEVYPTLTVAQREAYLNAQREQGIGLWEHVRTLQTELTALNEALSRWGQETTAFSRLLSRQRVGRNIRRCWRRKAGSYGAIEHRLTLDGARVGSLPALPAGLRFQHITELTLRDMALEAISPEFFQHFPNLRVLNLRHNRLGRFPEGLEQLTQLQDLRLGDNRIVLDAAGQGRLDQLSGLQRLDLGHNPLGLRPDFARLRRLRQFSLRACALDEVPADALRPPLLERGDLRDNQIQHLEPTLLAEPQQRLQRLALHDNPLAPQSAERLAAAQPASQGAAGHAHVVDDDATLQRLLGGLLDRRRAGHRASWQSLRQAPGGEDFFRFLGDLAQSVEFRQAPGAWRDRVWQVVECCEQNEQVREAVFQQAAGPGSCADRLLLVFSALESRARVIRRTAGLSGAALERELLLEGRAMYRLDQVQRLASEHYRQAEQGWRAAQASAPGQFTAPDDVEIFLAYRINLAERLGLPDQPASMRYAHASGVTQAHVDAARRLVLAEETPQALVDSLQGRDFWLEHLRERFADRFEHLDRPFYQQLDVLYDSATDLQDQAYLQAGEAIAQARSTAQAGLLRTLSEQALARHASHM